MDGKRSSIVFARNNYHIDVKKITGPLAEHIGICSEWDVVPLMPSCPECLDFTHRSATEQKIIAKTPKCQFAREGHLLVKWHTGILSGAHPRNLDATHI